jgi:hypothetical protein
MNHYQRASRRELDRKVPIRNGVNAVRRYAIEFQLNRELLPVDVKTVPRESAGTQRHDINSPPYLGQPFEIARQHFEIGQAPMSPQNGLSFLQMSVAGDRCVSMPFGSVQKCLLERRQKANKIVDLLPDKNSKRRCNLIVAAAAGVDLFTKVAGYFDKLILNERMNVFVSRIIKESVVRACRAFKTSKRTCYLGNFISLQNASPAKRPCISDAREDVREKKSFIE